MNQRHFRYLDAISAILLSLWAMAAIVTLVFGHFEPVKLGKWLDYGAWLAFGGAFCLSYGSRWLEEIQDEAPIGPLRLWSAAALAALLICTSSALLVTARWRELAMVDPQKMSQAAEHSLGRARSLSIQFFVIRILLAIGLAATLRRLARSRSA